MMLGQKKKTYSTRTIRSTSHTQKTTDISTAVQKNHSHLSYQDCLLMTLNKQIEQLEAQNDRLREKMQLKGDTGSGIPGKVITDSEKNKNPTIIGTVDDPLIALKQLETSIAEKEKELALLLEEEINVDRNLKKWSTDMHWELRRAEAQLDMLFRNVGAKAISAEQLERLKEEEEDLRKKYQEIDIEKEINQDQLVEIREEFILLKKQEEKMVAEISRLEEMSKILEKEFGIKRREFGIIVDDYPYGNAFQKSNQKFEPESIHIPKLTIENSRLDDAKDVESEIPFLEKFTKSKIEEILDDSKKIIRNIHLEPNEELSRNDPVDEYARKQLEKDTTKIEDENTTKIDVDGIIDRPLDNLEDCIPYLIRLRDDLKLELEAEEFKFTKLDKIDFEEIEKFTSIQREHETLLTTLNEKRKESKLLANEYLDTIEQCQRTLKDQDEKRENITEIKREIKLLIEKREKLVAEEMDLQTWREFWDKRLTEIYAEEQVLDQKIVDHELIVKDLERITKNFGKDKLTLEQQRVHQDLVRKDQKMLRREREMMDMKGGMKGDGKGKDDPKDNDTVEEHMVKAKPAPSVLANNSSEDEFEKSPPPPPLLKKDNQHDYDPHIIRPHKQETGEKKYNQHTGMMEKTRLREMYEAVYGKNLSKLEKQKDEMLFQFKIQIEKLDKESLKLRKECDDLEYEGVKLKDEFKFLQREISWLKQDTQNDVKEKDKKMLQINQDLNKVREKLREKAYL